MAQAAVPKRQNQAMRHTSCLLCVGFVTGAFKILIHSAIHSTGFLEKKYRFSLNF